MADEISKKELFFSGMSALGRSLRKGADELRKAAGVGVGEIRLELPSSGEHGGTLEGTLTLELTEPTEAKAVEVTLLAEREVTHYEKDTHGRRVPHRSSENVYRHTVQLAGAGTYQDEVFAVSLPLPNADGEIAFDGVVGDLVKAARVLHTLVSGGVTWRVEAAVVVPWKRNIRASHGVAIR